jgi:hypothetical protein
MSCAKSCAWIDPEDCDVNTCAGWDVLCKHMDGKAHAATGNDRDDRDMRFNKDSWPELEDRWLWDATKSRRRWEMLVS